MVRIHDGEPQIGFPHPLQRRSDVAPALVLVLAAGEGTRMRSSLAKVLHPILGRPLVGHVLTATEPLDAATTCVVVGHQRERVTEWLSAHHDDVLTAVQVEQGGTGIYLKTLLPRLGIAEALADPAIHLHLYDKAEVFERRKMAHLTALGATSDDALARARAAVFQVPGPEGKDQALGVITLPAFYTFDVNQRDKRVYS